MSLSNLIEIATDERQTEDNWGKIIDVCEKGSTNSKECLRLILRRLFNKNPHIVLRSIILLDACVQNIGEPFTKELSSRHFVNEIKSKSKNIHRKALERLCFMMKKWSRELVGGEYDCINELNKWLQDTYPDFYAAGDDELNSRNSNKMSRKNMTGQEEDDLAKAIALSLKESEGKRQTMYPTSFTGPSTTGGILKAPVENVQAKKQLPKVRALYDFEAAEDNELTFKAGEIIIDVDMSNEHWWYGSNHRGQGMFPAQFVTADLDSDIGKGSDNTVKRNETDVAPNDSFFARPPTPVIDESKIDECLLVLEDADPTGEMRPDPPELAKLEAQCRVMGPLIDQELEKVDRHYNKLVELNRKTIESFQLYNELMTQGGMSRPTSYQWPQNVVQGLYSNMPPQDPTQIHPRLDNINQGSQMPGMDPMLYQQMNYFNNMTSMQNHPEMMYANPQFASNKSQSIPQNPNQSFPTMSHIPQMNLKPEYPNSTNNSGLTNMNYSDMDLRSLPTQSNYAKDNSFQSVNMSQPHFSNYVQKEPTFSIPDGFH